MQLFVMHQVSARLDAVLTVGLFRRWRAADAVLHQQ
jgi:hypothetical protein